MKKIAEEDEILEYLTRLMRESEGREGLRAAELIGKRYAMFEKKPDEDVNINVTVDYGDKCDGEGQ